MTWNISWKHWNVNSMEILNQEHSHDIKVVHRTILDIFVPRNELNEYLERFKDMYTLKNHHWIENLDYRKAVVAQLLRVNTNFKFNTIDPILLEENDERVILRVEICNKVIEEGYK